MTEPNLDQMSLEQLLLDHAEKKYYLVNYVIKWINELSKREDSPKTQQGLMAVALRDIISGKITVKDIHTMQATKEKAKQVDEKDKNGKKEKK